MSSCFIDIRNLTFSYDRSPDPVFESVSLRLHRGWTGVVGPNGCGKTTLLKLITGLLIPESGMIYTPGISSYCEQRTDHIPAQFTAMAGSRSGKVQRLINVLGIHGDWRFRWSTLSHGERKRCQIAVALYPEPSVLAIDEPTNHLDMQMKVAVREALESFTGVGLLVSHDRYLLDKLCTHTMFIDTPAVDLRRGGYSDARDEREREKAYLINQRQNLKKQVKRLKKELGDRKRRAQASDRRRSKKKIAPKDRDSKSRIDLARLSGKDAVDGKRYKLLKNRIKRLGYHCDSIRKIVTQQMGIAFDESAERGLKTLIIPSGSISLGGSKHLIYPDLSIQERDRIGILGGNGTGKSTFVRHIVRNFNLPGKHIVYIPQEIPEDESQCLTEHIHRLNGSELGGMMTVISRLGSDPERLLDSTIPSPGEVRKLMLAEGIRRKPYVIIMDEPTNHMDLPSIECLEQALKACSCPLVLVSHDQVFLTNLATHYWSFGKIADSEYSVVESPSPSSG